MGGIPTNYKLSNRLQKGGKKPVVKRGPVGAGKTSGPESKGKGGNQQTRSLQDAKNYPGEKKKKGAVRRIAPDRKKKTQKSLVQVGPKSWGGKQTTKKKKNASPGSFYIKCKDAEHKAKATRSKSSKNQENEPQMARKGVGGGKSGRGTYPHENPFTRIWPEKNFETRKPRKEGEGKETTDEHVKRAAN